MKAQHRRREILDVLERDATVQIAELSKHLGVSRETVRKDLQILDQEGLVTQVRGGAVGRQHAPESAYHARRGANLQAKQSIAAKAATLVTPGMTIFLDYGTTTFALAKKIAEMDDLTVVTASIPIAASLASAPTVRVVLPGGILRPNEHSLYGPTTIRALQEVNFDIGFFGCAGIDPKMGATNPHMSEAHVSATALHQCSESHLLADSTKFGVVATYTFAHVKDFDRVITESIDGIETTLLSKFSTPPLIALSEEPLP